MSVVLSICVPTFNRASKLKQQLDVLIGLTDAYKETCELIVSDNHSTDNTAEILNTVRRNYPDRVISYQQEVNIGFVNNYRFLIQKATGEYIWIVGDDDPVYDTFLHSFFNAVVSQVAPVGVFHANHRCLTGENNVVHEQYYSVMTDRYEENGAELFQALAEDHQIGGLMFISASIFKIASARQAITQWKGSINNQALPLFVTAFAAAQNGMYYTAQNQLDCIYGESFWKNAYTHIFLHDVNEVFVNMRKAGYSRSFVYKQVRFNFYKYIGWRKFRQVFIEKPLYGLRIMQLFLNVFI